MNVFCSYELAVLFDFTPFLNTFHIKNFIGVLDYKQHEIAIRLN